MKRAQQGFTLVELAVVLLIIGLLLGGVLKGQSLIDSAKVKNLAQDFRSLPALVHVYQDRFRALPGDDLRATGHLCGGAASCTTAGNGNGLLDGNWDDSSTSESFLFWQHVRLAELASGSTVTTAEDYLPRNAMGGRLGVQSSSVLGLKGNVLMCSAAIPGKLVRQLDQQLDDGDPASGSVRVGSGSGSALTAITAATLDDDQAYTVCARL